MKEKILKLRAEGKSYRQIEKAFEEAAKCELICANCHRIHHALNCS